MRVTVDHERSLFRVVGGSLRALGEMGPRIEVKAADVVEANRVVSLLDPDRVLRQIRYRSLELLFQDVLRDAVPAARAVNQPEIEVKFELGRVDMAVAAAAVTDWIDRHRDVRLLLPYVHQIVRMRRYHFCEGDDDHKQRTIVETASGRLSAKVKRGEARWGAALVRETQASRRTDVDGARETVEAFARRHGWRCFNTMTKAQAKIPFELASGDAYLVSVDDCLDTHGTPLRQLEVEHIGGPRPTKEVCAQLDALSTSLQRGLPELELRPSTESKFGFYRRHSRG